VSGIAVKNLFSKMRYLIKLVILKQNWKKNTSIVVMIAARMTDACVVVVRNSRPGINIFIYLISFVDFSGVLGF